MTTRSENSSRARHWNEAGLFVHAIDPRAQGRVRCEVEASLVGHVGVRKQRDSSNRVTLAHEEATRPKVALHHRERFVASLELLGDLP